MTSWSCAYNHCCPIIITIIIAITTAIIISFTGQGIGAGILSIRIGSQVFTFTTTAQPPTVLPPHIPPPAPPPSGGGYYGYPL